MRIDFKIDCADINDSFTLKAATDGMRLFWSEYLMISELRKNSWKFTVIEFIIFPLPRCTSYIFT